METFVQAVRSLGPLRLTIMAGMVLGLIGFFIYLTTRLASPTMTMLYSNLDPDDSARIISQLESTKVSYDIRNNGGSIYVPDESVDQIRLTMADQGLPGGSAVGYELFDDASGLGSTEFLQNVKLVRALEGELAKTIRSIEQVKSARVHLVMPKRELFSREKPKPTASIILKLRGGGRLEPEQIQAIQHLVATAVPGLTPNHISIVDGAGSLLARGYQEKEGSFASAKTEERRRAYEVRVRRTIEELLERTVGFGNVRAEVTAEMDFDRVTTNEETYNPDGQVVRSTQTVEETSTSRETDSNTAVSVATNLPDGGGGAGENASNTAAESRTEEVVNFEISKKITNQIRDSGVIRRLSVAVLVDGTYEGEPPNETYKPRTEEEMELFATLVRGAVGFDGERGDAVEVINMQFAKADDDDGEKYELFFGLEKKDLLRMAEILVLSIVAILVILLVVRPLISRALEAMPAAAADAEALLSEHVAPALAGPGMAGADEDEYDEMIDLDRIEGRVKASSMKKIGEIVDKHPDEALAIVRSWLYAET